MSRLRLNLLAADPTTPLAGKAELYGRTSDKLLRTIDENAVVRRVGNVWIKSNTADEGPTAGANFYLAASSVPVSQLVAGSLVRWRVSCTKTAACTGTPAFQVVLGTTASTSDAVIATSTGLAQTAAIDTAWIDIEMIIRGVTSSSAAAWTMRIAHKLATTGFANAAQDQIFNGTTSNQNWTTAGQFLGLMFNPTATTANGVWTFQTISTLVGVA